MSTSSLPSAPSSPGPSHGLAAAPGDAMLRVGKHEFSSRLLVGTGKYATFELMKEALDASGCEIVTVPHDILGKAAKMYGMDLTALSLDTVKMFAKDAAAAGFKL